MSTYEEGKTTAKSWRVRKLYLSDEAHTLLANHCKGTPMTMSAFVDTLIKRELDSPAERWLREDAALTAADALTKQAERSFTTQDGTTLPAVAKRIAEVESNTGGPPRDPREPLGEFQEVKQPTKKDFKIDL